MNIDISKELEKLFIESVNEAGQDIKVVMSCIVMEEILSISIKKDKREVELEELTKELKKALDIKSKLQGKL
jgi:hypothetical protein